MSLRLDYYKQSPELSRKLFELSNALSAPKERLQQTGILIFGLLERI